MENVTRKESWHKFQVDICNHFSSIGAEAEVDYKIRGVRTSHDVDVYVKTRYLGQNMSWVVEAKYWKKKVTKSHVLALRSIVDDVGADKGFIISSGGFQRGAMEAAVKTNIVLTTFSDLKKTTRELVEGEILNAFIHRARLLTNRYWSHSKK